MALSNYGDKDFSLRSFAQSMGLSSELLSKPVAGIAYTRSGFNNCHHHFPELLEAVKRGVLAASALPLEFSTISLGEGFLLPAPSPKTLSSDPNPRRMRRHELMTVAGGAPRLIFVRAIPKFYAWGRGQVAQASRTFHHGRAAPPIRPEQVD